MVNKDGHKLCNKFAKKREPIVEFELESELGEEPHEELPERWALEDVMTKLTKEEKDIILLRFYHDYTLSQVAQVLRLKLGTTKTILYRALKIKAGTGTGGARVNDLKSRWIK